MPFNPDEPRGADGKWSSGLMDSLVHQLKAKDKSLTPEKARDLATEIMSNQGTLNRHTGELTPLGKMRENLGRAGRRIDRAAKQLGRHPSELGYKHGKPYVK